VCCAVEEIVKHLEGNLEQKIDEHLVEQHEIEALDEGQYTCIYLSINPYSACY